jgi:hypothetical protein
MAKFKLKSEKVSIDGNEFVVHEMPLSVSLPLFNALSASNGNMDAVAALLGAAVSYGGEMLGDDAKDLGTSMLTSLQAKVLKINGMGTDLGNAH